MPFHCAHSDLVFVGPKLGEYEASFVVGRFELTFVGPNHDSVLRKQPALAVQCNEKLDAEWTREDARVAMCVDAAFEANGCKVIRFSANDLVADPAACARRVHEALAPTWLIQQPGNHSSHPYDVLMRPGEK